MIVYNAEPQDYSLRAIEKWKSKGYVYKPGSWKEIGQDLFFPKVKILIVRLRNKVEAEILEKFPDLNYLVSATTGHDHLDLQAIKTGELNY